MLCYTCINVHIYVDNILSNVNENVISVHTHTHTDVPKEKESEE